MCGSLDVQIEHEEWQTFESKVVRVYLRRHDAIISFTGTSNAHVILNDGFLAFFAFGASTFGLFDVVRCCHD
jgi:hypothetical protein